MKNVKDVHVHRYDEQALTMVNESIAAETLVHLRVNGKPISSLLASPEHLDDLIIGHLATEYGLEHQSQDKVSQSKEAEELVADLQTQRDPQIDARTSIVTSSCGACDQSNLSSLIQQMPSVDSPEKLTNLDDVIQALYKMRSHQKGFSQTGGMHAAGLLVDDGLLRVREDIGRHNAVDKVYGHWSRTANKTPLALLLSGRCGWDIVSKAAFANIPVIVSVGAVSSLAARTAREAELTLISFVRDGKSIIISPFQGRFDTKD